MRSSYQTKTNQNIATKNIVYYLLNARVKQGKYHIQNNRAALWASKWEEDRDCAPTMSAHNHRRQLRRRRRRVCVSCACAAFSGLGTEKIYIDESNKWDVLVRINNKNALNLLRCSTDAPVFVVFRLLLLIFNEAKYGNCDDGGFLEFLLFVDIEECTVFTLHTDPHIRVHPNTSPIAKHTNTDTLRIMYLLFLPEPKHRKSKKLCFSHFRCRIWAVCLCATEWMWNNTTTTVSLQGSVRLGVFSGWSVCACACTVPFRKFRSLFRFIFISLAVVVFFLSFFLSFGRSAASSPSCLIFYFTFFFFFFFGRLLVCGTHSALFHFFVHCVQRNKKKVQHEINTSNCVNAPRVSVCVWVWRNSVRFYIRFYFSFDARASVQVRVSECRCVECQPASQRSRHSMLHEESAREKQNRVLTFENILLLLLFCWLYTVFCCCQQTTQTPNSITKRKRKKKRSVISLLRRVRCRRSYYV